MSSAIRSLVAYLLLLLGFSLAGWGLLEYGRKAIEAASIAAPEIVQSVSAPAGDGHARHPLSVLLLQLVVVLATARLCGVLMRRLGQPNVIGEMTAGILLGPSVLGLLWPAAEAYLFPRASLGTLSLLSQV
ncbi:MAG TPA: cation:proton antiporter, partial [Fibrobacteria bacterium]|nr:cation:proton antiporter [Fibrobacteria bacterium]